MQQQAHGVDHHRPEPDSGRSDAINRFALSNSNDNAANHADADDEPKLLLIATDHVDEIRVSNHHPVGQRRHHVRQIRQPERSVISARFDGLVKDWFAGQK